MNTVLALHIGSGAVALAAGSIAMSVRKGGNWHVRAGLGFVVAMLVLGLTAAVLAPLKTPAESPVGGLMVCYFATTAWLAARRRNGMPGLPEKIACTMILVMAVAILWGGFELAQTPAAERAGPPGPGVLIALGTLCLLAGLGDLRYVLRGRLSCTQRLSRHLWRMCFAFFLATGSFFLGQMDVLPPALRAMPLLLILAFAPLLMMLFWLVRVRLTLTRPLRTSPPHPAGE